MKRHLLGCVAAVVALPAVSLAQDVIINEWTQGNGGNKEWIEALVVNGPVDMRGWYFSDTDGTTLNSPRLSNSANWSAVPTGTIVVLYHHPEPDTVLPADDDDFTDGNFKIVIPTNHPTLMETTVGLRAFANSTLTDNPRLLDSTFTVVHDWDQGDNASFAVGTLRPGANQAVQFDGNSVATALVASNWTRISAAVATPGFPNGAASANETWILGLRGIAPDDPNIDASTTTVQFGRILPTATQDLNIVVSNTGAANNLNVAASTITGPGAAAFSIEAQPTGITPGGNGNVTVRFNPANTAGVYQATLTINSNDTSGDAIVVPLIGSAADVAPFAGLYITEMVSQPTPDEFVEIQNTSGATIDISGVIISDEDNSNTEGSLKFPAGTTIAADEVIVVAVNNSTTQPSWLASVPSGTRVFFDQVRAGGAWTAPLGVTLIAMDDFDVIDGGTSGDVALSADDGVTLYHPLTVFGGLFGPSAPSMALDGLNYDNTATSPLHPINSNGDFDTQATRVGAGQPASGSSIKRLTPTVNTASNVTFEVSAGLTPGVAFPASSVSDWMLIVD